MRPQTRSAASTLFENTRVEEQNQAHGGLAVPDVEAVEAVPRPRQAAEAQARLVISRGPDAGRELTLDQATTSFGRHRDCDVVLEDVTVSRYHADILHEGGRYVLVDDGSLNGTYLNRKPIDRAELSDGDEIWIGKARFVFRTDG